MRCGGFEERCPDSCHREPRVVRSVGEIAAPSSRNDSIPTNDGGENSLATLQQPFAATHLTPNHGTSE
jgi:hypothetical protein